jgi:uncharacterized protein YcfJ
MKSAPLLRIAVGVMAGCLAGCAIRTAGPPDAPGGAWGRIRTLDERTVILVTVDGAPEARCWFVSANDSTLVVRDTRIRSQPETIPRPSVVQVRAQEPRNLGRGIAGFLLGGLGGGLVGGLVGGAVSDDEAAGIAGVGIGYWAGAITGAIIGANGGWRRPFDVIYRRP